MIEKYPTVKEIKSLVDKTKSIIENMKEIQKMYKGLYQNTQIRGVECKYCNESIQPEFKQVVRAGCNKHVFSLPCKKKECRRKKASEICVALLADGFRPAKGHTLSQETIDIIKEKRSKNPNYIKFMKNRKGKTFEELYGKSKSLEIKKKITDARLKQPCPRLGTKHSEESKELMRKSRIKFIEKAEVKYMCVITGKKVNYIEFKKSQGKVNYNKLTEEEKQKRNRNLSEIIKKIWVEKGELIFEKRVKTVEDTYKVSYSIFQTLGVFFSKEEIIRMIQDKVSLLEVYANCRIITTAPYTPLFYDENYRHSLLLRQNKKRGICEKELTLGKHTHLHHIDYDKQNDSADNLLFLDSSCHAKTTHSRYKWKELCLKKIEQYKL